MNAGLLQARTAQNYMLMLAAIAIIAALSLAFLFSARRWLIVLPLPALGFAALSYVKNRAYSGKLMRLRRFYERGIARIDGRFAGAGFSGEEYSDPGHVYAADLNLFGRGSLFELLCTARSEPGRGRLARYLLDQPDLQEAQSRQRAVAELRDEPDLREKIVLLGKFDFEESSYEAFAEWLKSEAAFAPRSTRILMFAASAFTAWGLLGVFCIPALLVQVLPWVVSLAALNGVMAWFERKRTRQTLAGALCIGREIGVLREGIELIQTARFRSPKLLAIQNRLAGNTAAAALRKLERLTVGLSDCERESFYLAARLLAARSQFCMAIGQWRREHAHALDAWLDAWSEFDALAALSCYAHEHQEDVSPIFSEGDAIFQASDLGHPLMLRGACVRNDIEIGPRHRFLIVSGSNMAGKSTLLRAIGLNAVLAFAGAPVRAKSLRISALRVCASISMVDSPLEGRSKFLAEVDRLQQALSIARGHRSALFLIDEMLSGTNSRDRRVAAEAVVRALMDVGSIGALSTHDMALTEIAELDGLAGLNVHMESKDEGDPMVFDYLVKPGICTQSNALAIVRMAGVKI